MVSQGGHKGRPYVAVAVMVAGSPFTAVNWLASPRSQVRSISILSQPSGSAAGYFVQPGCVTWEIAHLESARQWTGPSNLPPQTELIDAAATGKIATQPQQRVSRALRAVTAAVVGHPCVASARSANFEPRLLLIVAA